MVAELGQATFESKNKFKFFLSFQYVIFNKNLLYLLIQVVSSGFKVVSKWLQTVAKRV